VKLVCSNKDASIYYTTDGKEPQPGVSPRYQSPVLADGDRIIKAIAVDGKKKSTTATRTFTGSKAHWSTLPDKAGMLVFDENQHTTWVGKDVLEVDLQSAKEMTGISYLPDQARWANGIVVKYMIEISLDGIRWEEAARGEFANIQNNPVEQQVIFRQTHKGRYIRFHALSTVDGQKSMGVAELDILFSKN